MSELLYGHNPEPGIVAVHHVTDQHIRIYKRVEGKIQHVDVEFFPFFFLTDKFLLANFSKQYWLKELHGTNPFRYIAVFRRWSDMWDAVHHAVKSYSEIIHKRISSYTEIPSIFLRNDPVYQFLLQSGITLFKGLQYDNLKITWIDLQKVESTIDSKKRKTHTTPHFCLTALTNDGLTFKQSSKKHNIKKVINDFIRFICVSDPDILIGENLTGDIFPFLINISSSLNIPLPLGRDMSPPRHRTNRLPFYTTETFSNPIEIIGRHTLDIYPIVKTFEHHLPSNDLISLDSLAEAVGYFTNINNTDFISKDSREKCPNVISERSISRVNILKDLTNKYLPLAIHIAQLCPLPLSTILQLNDCYYIESIVIREYIRHRHSLPQHQILAKQYFHHSEIFQTGIFQNILYLKIESLYYTAIKKIQITPQSDQLNIVRELRTTIEHKISQEVEYFTPQVKVLLILLNALPLMVGNPRTLFNDNSNAEVAHESTTSLLHTIVQTLDRFNIIPLHLERDTLYVALPDNVKGIKEEEALLERINASLIPPLSLTRIHSYKAMLSHRRRSFALLHHNQKLTIAGTSLYNKNAEPFLRLFTIECIRGLLENDFVRLHECYIHYYTSIINHSWSPMDFCRIEVAKMSLHEYIASLKNPNAIPTPGMEAAVRAMRNVKPGDHIVYFIGGTHADVKVTEHSILIDEWNPLSPNENTAFYIARLRDVIDRFKEFFSPTTFESVFSLDSLFQIESSLALRVKRSTFIPKSTHDNQLLYIEQPRIELDQSDSSN
ncbi:MAG: hypothetical protein N3A63_03965 [Bacteroidetes bacterium]|nr:hypothetical protein [Bacteroidota bacterium]